MKFKVVVIGAGYFGQRHINILSQMDDVEIVGIADKDYEIAKSIGNKFRVRYSDKYKDFLDIADIFFIITPTSTHFEIVMELIREGKNLFVEKPLTENLSEARLIIEEATKRGIIFQTGLIERFNPAFRTLLSHIKEPLFFSATRVSPFLGRATDTHVTFDLMIHDLDLIWKILHLIGEPEVRELKAFRYSIVTDKIDFADIWLDISLDKKNLNAHLTANRTSLEAQRRLCVIEKDATYHADLIKKTVFRVDRRGNIKEIQVENRETQPLYEEIRDFLDSVREKRLSKVAPTPVEIIEVLKLIERINGGSS